MIRYRDSVLHRPDGVDLFVRRWDATHPRGLSVLIHGLGEHSGRYAPLAYTLTEKSFSVAAFDHRGHGRSQGRRGDCLNFEMYLHDLHGVLTPLHAENPALPIFLIGHSLGGLIALSYAARHPEFLRGVAVSSPALKLAHKLPPAKVMLAETLSRILPTTSLPNGVHPEDLSRDPQVVAAYGSDPLIHHGITARCAVSLRRAMEEAALVAPKIQVPCLILQAGSDKVCDPEAVRRFAEAMSPGRWTFRSYEGFYHEIFNEPEKERVFQDLISWMEGVLRDR